MTAAVVFAAGPVSPGSLERLRSRVKGRLIDGRKADIVVAADGGLDLAIELGVEADLVVGDMDSVESDSLERAGRDGVEIRSYPRAKDESDYELAIWAAVASGAQRVTVVGSDSGRLDHLYATLLTLCSPRFAGVQLDAWLGGNHLAVLNATYGRSAQASTELHGEPGTQLSLFAMNGPVSGVTTTGLRWQLVGDSLESGSSRGVSNEFLAQAASVEVGSGCLAVVVPATGDAAIGGLS